MKRKRTIFLLGVLVIGGTALLWPQRQSIWLSMTTKRIPLPAARPKPPHPDFPFRVNPEVLRGWGTVKRWTDPPVAHGKAVAFDLRTGYRRFEFQYENGRTMRRTKWNSEGKVKSQWRSHDEDGNQLDRYDEAADKRSPPWWWGVRDKTEPTVPWWEE